MTLPSMNFSSLLQHCNYLRVVAASSLISVISLFNSGIGGDYNAIDVIIITFALLYCILILEYIVASVMVLMNIMSNDRRCVRRICRHSATDVIITFALLYCILILECTVMVNDSRCVRRICRHKRPWPDQVAQYNIIGYLARNRRHSWFRRLNL
jgi:hypothetical protein